MARTKQGFFFVKTLDGSPPAMDEVSLSGGTAYYEGQVLRVSATGGRAVRAGTKNTSVLGIAAANVTSSATTTAMPIYLATQNAVFEAVMPATGAPLTRRQDFVHVRIGTTHNYRLQGSAATEMFRVVGYHPDDASGTAANKRYWVIVNYSLYGQRAASVTK